MAQEPRDIVLEQLRRIDHKIDGLRSEMGSMNLRMAAMERHMLGQLTSEVDQNDEIGRLKLRVDRIERRLELTEHGDADL